MKKFLTSLALALLAVFSVLPCAYAEEYVPLGSYTAGEKLNCYISNVDAGAQVVSLDLPRGCSLVDDFNGGTRRLLLGGAPTEAGQHAFSIQVSGVENYTINCSIDLTPALPSIQTCQDVTCAPGSSVLLSVSAWTADGGSLSVSAKAEVKPYLTKNRVTYRDLIPGVKLLVWFDGTAADRVLLLSSGETPFADVAQDHWAYQDILACASEGLLSGDQSLSFRPGEALTRAELVKALYHMAGCPAVAQSIPAFTDMKSGDYISALTWAVGNKLVSGYADNTFRPDAPVTRQQLAAFLYRWEQHRGGGFQGAWMFLLDYTDRDSISDYAYEGVAWCTMNGVLTGRSDGTLAPGAPVTRAAAAVMLQRYLGLQDAKN